MRHVRIIAILGLFALLGAVFACSPSGISGTSAGATISTTSTVNTASALIVTALTNTIAPGGGFTTITARVVDSLGNNVPDGTVVTFAFAPGDQVKASLSAGGGTTLNGMASVTITSTIFTNSIAVVNAACGSAAGSISIAIQAASGSGGTVTVAASPTIITVSGTTTITATVKDLGGNLVQGANVTFSLNNANATLSLTTVQTNAIGQASTVLTGVLTPNVTVTATVVAMGNIQGTFTVTINPQVFVPTLTISATASSILTSGNTTITAVLSGFTGTTVGVPVTFTVDNTSAASLSSASVLTDANGIATVTLTATNIVTTVKVTASATDLGPPVTPVSNFTSISITAAPPDSVVLTTNPASSITVYGTSTLSALVTASGNPVPDGTLVNFILNDSTFGSLSSTSGSTRNGIVSVTFTATNKSGSVTVTAVAGSKSSSPATITIAPPITGSIQFVSATPQLIGIKSSGTNVSTVVFKVLDTQGNLVSGASLTFTLAVGPGGGACLQGSAPGCSTTSTTGSTDSKGIATVFLESGNTAGPVTIIASTSGSGGAPISTSASQVSIGGGVVSATHFNIATSQFNLPGLLVSDAQAKITAYVADRFGNFNILQGTTVSFQNDAGAMATASTTDSTGITSAVIFRTQSPYPQPVAIVPWEVNLINYLNRTYSATGASTTVSNGGLGVGIADVTVNVVSTAVFPFTGWIKIDGEVISYTGETATSFIGCTRGLFGTTATTHIDGSTVSGLLSLNIPNDGTAGHPRNGWVTLLASVPGEETFNDLHGTGLYQLGDPFVDISEPYADRNGDGCWNSGTNEICDVAGAPVTTPNTDPYEKWIDTNGNGVWDIPNGVWDGPGCMDAGCQPSKVIWTNMSLAFTGNPVYCSITPLTIGNMPFGSSKSFSFMVGDENINYLIPGTTVNATATAGTLVGQTSFTQADGLPHGPTEIFFTLQAPGCASPPCTPAPVSITVTVTPKSPEVGCTQTVTGIFQ